jgi:hypothetical protein
MPKKVPEGNQHQTPVWWETCSRILAELVPSALFIGGHAALHVWLRYCKCEHTWWGQLLLLGTAASSTVTLASVAVREGVPLVVEAIKAIIGGYYELLAFSSQSKIGLQNKLTLVQEQVSDPTDRGNHNTRVLPPAHELGRLGGEKQHLDHTVDHSTERGVPAPPPTTQDVRGE